MLLRWMALWHLIPLVGWGVCLYFGIRNTVKGLRLRRLGDKQAASYLIGGGTGLWGVLGGVLVGVRLMVPVPDWVVLVYATIVVAWIGGIVVEHEWNLRVRQGGRRRD